MKIYGEYTLDEKERVVCKCGRSDSFQMIAHFDMTDRAISQYECTNCGNIIETELKREVPRND